MQNVIYPRMTDDLLQQLYAEEKRAEKREKKRRVERTPPVGHHIYMCHVVYVVVWCVVWCVVVCLRDDVVVCCVVGCVVLLV